jgi:hypothetical protein
VSYADRLELCKVTRRWIDPAGQVYLSLKTAQGNVIPQERVEVLTYYPEVGDLCEIAAHPYLEWAESIGNYALPDWCWKSCELVEIKGSMARVRPQGEGQKTRPVPFAALRVREKGQLALEE